MSRIFFAGRIFVLCLVLVALAWTGAGSQTNPLWEIAEVTRENPMVDVPIYFTANGALINVVVFSVDFDETRLWFDPTDGNDDGIPDSVNLNLPVGFNASVAFDPADTDGELNFFIADTSPPLASLPDGTPVTITFGAVEGSLGIAPVVFSSDPPLSCGNTAGQSEPCDTDDGLVRIVPLAVHLSEFSAIPQVDHVLIEWETVSEWDHQGFYLYRSESPAAPAAFLAYLPAQTPGGTAGAHYRWVDDEVHPGKTYYYWLEDIALSGITTLHGPVSVTMSSPAAVKLSDYSAESGEPAHLPWWVISTLEMLLREMLLPEKTMAKLGWA
ncbi:MAG: hypothetical protein U9R25_11785 [Chloroflexota bacterium]|nr:hypothetical protein [Chloroflexota bacterium]